MKLNTKPFLNISSVVSSTIHCHYVALWFLSPSTMLLRFIHTVEKSVSFSLMSSIPLCGYTSICLSMHQLVGFWAVSSVGVL